MARGDTAVEVAMTRILHPTISTNNVANAATDRAVVEPHHLRRRLITMEMGVDRIDRADLSTVKASMEPEMELEGDSLRLRLRRKLTERFITGAAAEAALGVQVVVGAGVPPVVVITTATDETAGATMTVSQRMGALVH
jgi:hypothetical protein